MSSSRSSRFSRTIVSAGDSFPVVPPNKRTAYVYLAQEFVKQHHYVIVFGLRIEVGKLGKKSENLDITGKVATESDYENGVFYGKVARKEITAQMIEDYCVDYRQRCAKNYSLLNDNCQAFAQNLIQYATQGAVVTYHPPLAAHYAVASGPRRPESARGVIYTTVGQSAAGYGIFQVSARGPSALLQARDGMLAANYTLGEARGAIGPVAVQVGLSIDTNVGIKDKSVQLKYLGTGVSVGKHNEVALLGNSVSVDCLIM